MIHYACDFEATILPDGFVFNENERTKKIAYQAEPEVYLATAVNVDDPTEPPVVLHSIGEFLEWVFSLPSCNLYFHNLTGYDGWFIQSALLRSGYIHVLKNSFNFDHEYFYMGLDDSFTVFGRGHGVYNFIDSKKILKGSIAQFGEMVNLPKGDETPLVEIGSSLERTLHRDSDGGEIPGHYWTWAEAEEYAVRDVEVLAAAMRAVEVPNKVENGLTSQAGIAMAALKTRSDLMGLPRKDAFRARYKPTYPKPTKAQRDTGLVKYIGWRDGSPVFGRKGDVAAPHVFEVTKQSPFRVPRKETSLKGEALKRQKQLIEIGNKVAKEGYKGGINYANPAFTDDWVGYGTKLDVNSMYPWIYATKHLPKAEPVAIENEVLAQDIHARPFEFAYVQLHDLRATVKDGRMPLAKPRTDSESTRKHMYEDGELFNNVYAKDIDMPMITLTLAEVDYLLENYHVHNVTPGTTVWYERDEELEQAFQEHCDKWMHVKATSPSNSFAKWNAKMMLNCVYGKLGEYTKQYPNTAHSLADDGSINTVMGEPETVGKTTCHISAAGYITAYGRIHLANTINQIGMDRFLYCDTDSVMFLGENDIDLPIDATRLGAWKLEGQFTEARFIKCKTYGTVIDGHWHATAAGFSRQIAKENFEPGVEHMDSRSIKAATGTVICGYKMKVGQAASDAKLVPQNLAVVKRIKRLS